MLNLNFAFYLTTVLAFMFGIDRTEGIRWINTPSQINTCAGETANLTWEYEKEDGEDIRQFQWRFNKETLIAYRSTNNGLHIDDKYKERINGTGDTGILLKNISSKDTGNYSLYTVIAWEEKRAIQSIWLNVIDADDVAIEPWCTCERLPMSPEWNGGKNINVETDGCSLELNSSFCCIKHPTSKCMGNNPKKTCVPIREPAGRIETVTKSWNTKDPTEHVTHNRFVPDHTTPNKREPENMVSVILMVTIICLFVIGIVISVTVRLPYCRKKKLCEMSSDNANMEMLPIMELGAYQRTPMMTEIMDMKRQIYNLEHLLQLQERDKLKGISHEKSLSQSEELFDYQSLLTVPVVYSDFKSWMRQIYEHNKNPSQLQERAEIKVLPRVWSLPKSEELSQDSSLLTSVDVYCDSSLLTASDVYSDHLCKSSMQMASSSCHGAHHTRPTSA